MYEENMKIYEHEENMKIYEHGVGEESQPQGQCASCGKSDCIGFTWVGA